MNRTQESSVQSRMGEAKEKAMLIATDGIQEYMDKVYVKNTENYSDGGINTEVVNKLNSEGPGQMPHEISIVAQDKSGNTPAKVMIYYSKPNSGEAQMSVTGTIEGGRITWGEIKYDAAEAEEARRQAEEYERNRQAFISTVNNAIKDKADEDNKVKLNDLKTVLATYFTNESMTAIEKLDLTDETVQTGTSLTRTTANGGYVVTISEILNGITVTDERKPVTELHEGDRVVYTDQNGNPISCIVLYDSTGSNGIQIISVGTVGDYIELGNGTGNSSYSSDLEEFAIANESYNTLIMKLNNVARNYLNPNLATSARCVGSDPSEPPVYVETNTGDVTYSGFKFKPTNNNVTNSNGHPAGDVAQMGKSNINCKQLNYDYWLASRNIGTSYGNPYFSAYRVKSNGSIEAVNLGKIIDNRIFSCSQKSKIRAIFTLNSNIHYLEENGRKTLVQ